MNEILKLKDLLYYSDLITDLKRYAQIEYITDTVQEERIRQRRKMILIPSENDCPKYRSSDYSIEFMNIARQIYLNATGDDGLAWLEQLRIFPNEVNKAILELEKKKLDNEMLIQLVSVIKDMGLEDKFSLGESREQCVCLDKNDNSWEVYIVENGTSFEKSVHEECFDACIEVINLLADSKQMYESAKEKFGMVRKLVPNK